MSKDKQLWLLAGGNGAGKSTFYEQFLATEGLPFVNADILAQQLDVDNPESVSYRAAELVEKLRTQLLHAEVNFCFETVFSHPSKIDFLAQAKILGYEIILVYIHLQSAELNQARVAQRVKQGGHRVPVDKIISRLPRTQQYIRQALALVDLAQLYDNSSQQQPFLPVAQLKQGQLSIQQAPLPDWAEHILNEYL